MLTACIPQPSIEIARKSTLYRSPDSRAGVHSYIRVFDEKGEKARDLADGNVLGEDDVLCPVTMANKSSYEMITRGTIRWSSATDVSHVSLFGRSDFFSVPGVFGDPWRGTWMAMYCLCALFEVSLPPAIVWQQPSHLGDHRSADEHVSSSGLSNASCEISIGTSVECH